MFVLFDDVFFVFYRCCDHRELHVLTHSFPTRRSSDLLTFVVVGAGPTGVEMAGALAELARFALSKDFRRIDPRLARVVLVEAGPRVLPPFPEDLGAKAARRSEEHTSALQSLMRISYAVFCLNKKQQTTQHSQNHTN